MKQTLLFTASLIICLSACAPAEIPSPTPEPPNIEATVGAIAATMVAGTLAAIPTNTPIPTATIQPTVMLIPTQTPSATPTATSSSGSVNWSCNMAGVGTATMVFQNDSDQQVSVMIDSDSCHREFLVDPGNSVSQTVPIDVYYYGGYIGWDTDAPVGYGGSVLLGYGDLPWIVYIDGTGSVLEAP